MMSDSLKLSEFDLIVCLSKALDLIAPEVVNHHLEVAYIGFQLSKELGLSSVDQNLVAMAGALHDIGAISLQSRLDSLKFEIVNPEEHMELGYRLLASLDIFSDLANIVRYHHLPWDSNKVFSQNGNQVPLGSHIIHLADRVAVCINKQEEILSQVPGICSKIQENSGKKFDPQIVDAFMNLSTKEYIWLDVISVDIERLLAKKIRAPLIELESDSLLNIAKLFSFIIDFRSRFTATHSSGVAVTAENISELLGFSEKECLQMRIAGYLHDLGKLAVPAEILEKPGKLSDNESDVIRKHTYYTYRILERIEGLKAINDWASFHHERINGSGYPFHKGGEDICLKSRIMAVADVFTALTEDRPYRKGMSERETMEVVKTMARDKKLDNYVVSLLDKNFDWINRYRKTIQAAAEQEYNRFASYIYNSTGAAGRV